MRRDVYVIGGIVMGLVSIAVVGGNWLMNNLFGSLRPEQIAETYFETPVRDMRDLKGEGMEWMGYQHKVRFCTDGPVKIKSSDLYESFKPEETDIDGFKSDFPEDASQFEKGEPLECLRIKVPEPTAGSSGRYFVNNTKSHTYFFRSWNSH